jgi:DNA-directed RNA polymerase specialized sigma24 family protein
MSYERINERANELIQQYREIEEELVQLCIDVTKPVIKEGFNYQDVMDQYFFSVRECIPKHDPDRKNFCSFLRQNIKSRLLDEIRKEKRRERIVEKNFDLIVEKATPDTTLNYIDHNETVWDGMRKTARVRKKNIQVEINFG